MVTTASTTTSSSTCAEYPKSSSTAPSRPAAACGLHDRQLADQQEAQHEPGPHRRGRQPRDPGDDRTGDPADDRHGQCDQDGRPEQGADADPPPYRHRAFPRRRPVKRALRPTHPGDVHRDEDRHRDHDGQRWRTAPWRSGRRPRWPRRRSRADQRYMTSTARRGEWPSSSSRWCRCCLSGANGDRPARVRRTTASSRSSERHGHHRERQQQRQQGRARGRAGDGVAGRPCPVRVIVVDGEQQADQHRAGVAHEDPGRVEVVRQEAQAHADQHGRDQRRRRSRGRGRRCTGEQVGERRRTASAAMPTMPAASPSSPSTKLTALIVTHARRARSASVPSAGPSDEPCCPPAERQRRAAARPAAPSRRPRATWPASLVSASSSHRSSTTPSRQMSTAAGQQRRGLVGRRRTTGRSNGSCGGHQQRRDEAGEHRDPAEPRGRDRVHVAVAHLGHGAPARIASRRTSRREQVGHRRRDEQGEQVLAHGREPPDSDRCAGRPGDLADERADRLGDLGGRASRRRRAPRGRSGAAISFMSASVMPWVVTAGVPTRMPEATIGGCGSYGIAFLFSVIRAASQRASASRAGHADAAQVDQREVGVGAAGDRAHALGGQARRRAPARWRRPGGRTSGTPAAGLLERDRLGRDGVHQRAALQ